MTEAAGEDFDGMDRMEARKAVVEELTEQGLLLKTEDYVHNVGYSQRSHVPIEPYLSEQWFLKYPSVEPSTKAVEEGRIDVPSRALEQDLLALDAEPAGLVHQPPALVGAPGAGVVSRRPKANPRLARSRRAVWRERSDAFGDMAVRTTASADSTDW